MAEQTLNRSQAPCGLRGFARLGGKGYRKQLAMGLFVTKLTALNI